MRLSHLTCNVLAGALILERISVALDPSQNILLSRPRIVGTLDT